MQYLRQMQKKHEDFSLSVRYILKNLFAALLFSAFLFTGHSKAQTKPDIRGKLIDSATGKKVGSATVQLISSDKDSLILAGLSNENGEFSLDLRPGKFYLLIESIGYRDYKSALINTGSSLQSFDLGEIRLSPTVKMMEEVVVQAQKSNMELSLDKRIFNVGQELANSGGTASDVLMNIPSVSVDGEGNVSLRGSSSVRILIDGKPSGLVSFNGGAGLQQLQASMIERVEIITNPSARYEAEGMSGIINIILKKSRKRGFNGSFDVITGYPLNLGLAANVNYRHNKINFFINYGIAYRIQPFNGKLYQEVYNGDTTSYLRQANDGKLKGFNNTIRGGLDFFFSEKSILTGSYLFRRSDANRILDIRYEDYDYDPSKMSSYTLRNQNETEDEPNSEMAVTWKRNFKKKGHDFTLDLRYLDYWEKSDQVFTQQTYNPDGSKIPESDILQRSVNDEFEKQYLVQADYVFPVTENSKLEAGLRASFRDMVNDYVVTQQDDNGDFYPLPGLDNYFIYNEDIQALYAIYGNKYKKISYQAGLRAEWTNVKTTLLYTNEINPRKYANLFPSAHISFDLGNDNALQISYSRRVRRPVYNELSPFFTFSDSRNFMSGNPNLNPEYTNAFEVGHIKTFENATLSTSLYFRDSKDKIMYIRTVNDSGFSVTKPENLNGENAFGAEFVSTYNPWKWWKMDFNFNFFRAITDGKNINEGFESDTWSWFTRLNSRFNFNKKTEGQVRLNYEAPQKTPQGSRKAMFYMDLAGSMDILKNNATLTLNIIDVFNSRRTRSITEGSNFYTSSNFLGRVRQINLTLNYRLNQAKSVRKSEE